MSQSLYKYTNRQGKTYYIRAVPSKKGKMRYYLTQNQNADSLIQKIPTDFEVVEYPYDAKVVVRKKIPVHTLAEEQVTIRQAMENYSPVKDFLITAEQGDIAIHISQFSNYHDGLYPDIKETKELFGERVDFWKTYDWIMTFRLLDGASRNFQVIRKAHVRYDSIPIAEGKDLAVLAKEYCSHVGLESLLKFWKLGEEDW